MDAALEEYGEHGWSGFTMDGVARRAGVGKSTVYLRWQDKDSLLTDAVGTASEPIGVVDTGSLRGDLREVAVNLLEHLLSPQGWAALRITIDNAAAPGQLGRFVEAVSEVQADNLNRIFDRAAERGEHVNEDMRSEIGECIYGTAVMTALNVRLERRTTTAEELAERSRLLVEMVLDGALR